MCWGWEEGVIGQQGLEVRGFATREEYRPVHEKRVISASIRGPPRNQSPCALWPIICRHCTPLFLFACVCVGREGGEVITPLPDLRESSERVTLQRILCYIRMCESMLKHVTLMFSLLHLDYLANLIALQVPAQMSPALCHFLSSPLSIWEEWSCSRPRVILFITLSRCLWQDSGWSVLLPPQPYVGNAFTSDPSASQGPSGCGRTEAG